MGEFLSNLRAFAQVGPGCPMSQALEDGTQALPFRGFPGLTTTLGASQLASATGHCTVQSLCAYISHGTTGPSEAGALPPVSSRAQHFSHIEQLYKPLRGWIPALPLTELSHSKNP